MCRERENILRDAMCKPAICKSQVHSAAISVYSSIHILLSNLFYNLFAVLFHSNGTASKWTVNRASADISKR